LCALHSVSVTNERAEGEARPEPPDWLAGYPEVMTSAEVARVLRFSEPVVRRMAARGEIKGQRFGRDWRFLRRDIRALMEGPPPEDEPPGNQPPGDAESTE